MDAATAWTIVACVLITGIVVVLVTAIKHDYHFFNEDEDDVL